MYSSIFLFAFVFFFIFLFFFFFFFSSRRRHTRCGRDWSSDVCSSDLAKTSFALSCPITYSSNVSLISFGVGNLSEGALLSLSCTSSRIMSLHRSTHSSQINTEGPAINLRTSCWLFPQNEQYKSLPSLLPLISSVIRLPHFSLTYLYMGTISDYFKD